MLNGRITVNDDLKGCVSWRAWHVYGYCQSKYWE